MRTLKFRCDDKNVRETIEKPERGFLGNKGERLESRSEELGGTSHKKVLHMKRSKRSGQKRVLSTVIV